MKHQARRTQGEVIDFLEQRCGWDVVEATLEEDEGFRDGEPTTLELMVVAEFELDDADSDYRHDPDEAIH